MRRKAEVTQGQVLVCSVDLALRRPGIRVYEIDCHTKYPEVAAYGGSDVLLMAGEHALKGNRKAGLTRVTLPVPAGWDTVMAGRARYVVRVVAWKPHRRRRDRKPLWMTDEDLAKLEYPPRNDVS